MGGAVRNAIGIMLHQISADMAQRVGVNHMGVVLKHGLAISELLYVYHIAVLWRCWKRILVKSSVLGIFQDLCRISVDIMLKLSG